MSEQQSANEKCNGFKLGDLVILHKCEQRVMCVVATNNFESLCQWDEPPVVSTAVLGGKPCFTRYTVTLPNSLLRKHDPIGKPIQFSETTTLTEAKSPSEHELLVAAIKRANDLRTAHNGIGGVYLYLGHDGDNVCELKDCSAKEVGKGGSGRSLLEAIERAEHDWENRKALKRAPDKKLGPVNEAEPIGHCAVEAAASHQCLDECNIPRVSPVSGKVLSLWGRMLIYANRQAD